MSDTHIRSTIQKTESEVAASASSEVEDTGWRWAFEGTSTWGVVPKDTMVHQWKRQVSNVIQVHVKGSRPSLAEKVTQLAKEMARECNEMSGKWMVFEKQTKNMDDKWCKVKMALARRSLGPAAKLSLNKGDRVMCIYTASFEDERDVWRVLQSLHSIGIYPTTWKADIVTYIGLYNLRKHAGIHGLVVPGLTLGWFTPNKSPIRC